MDKQGIENYETYIQNILDDDYLEDEIEDGCLNQKEI